MNDGIQIFVGGLPLLGGLSKETAQNLLESLMDASDNNCRYSDLSITTTPDPLSGLVMTMLSRHFNCSMASRSVLEGFCTLRWM